MRKNVFKKLKSDTEKAEILQLLPNVVIVYSHNIIVQRTLDMIAIVYPE